jgi:hypothetical protein
LRIVKCITCRYLRRLYVRGQCRCCYRRNHPNKRIVTCVTCGKDKPHYAKGKCRQCYHAPFIHRWQMAHRRSEEFATQPPPKQPRIELPRYVAPKPFKIKPFVAPTIRPLELASFCFKCGPPVISTRGVLCDICHDEYEATRGHAVPTECKLLPIPKYLAIRCSICRLEFHPEHPELDTCPSCEQEREFIQLFTPIGANK